MFSYLRLLIGVLFAACCAATVQADQIDAMPHVFTAGSRARAAEVNENMEALRVESNGQDTRVDTLESSLASISSSTNYALLTLLNSVPYGDGSAGDFTVVTTLLSWGRLPPPDNNTQFQNFGVSAGADVGIPSGTVIRATGDVVITGDIDVETYAGGGYTGFTVSSTPASPGAARGPAGLPDFRIISGNSPGDPSPTSHAIIAAGTGGRGILGSRTFGAAQLQRNGPQGGGGGTGTNLGGGAGGGTLTIIAAGDIIVDGNITANGEDGPAGGGGGGGGIVVLASATRIDVRNGSVVAGGGGGGDSSTLAGPGGGGGGGIVHLISPEILGASNIAVDGGTAGTVTGALSDPAVFMGGGGGGAGGAHGGRGGQIPNNVATPISAVGGLDGFAIESPINPMPLF